MIERRAVLAFAMAAAAPAAFAQTPDGPPLPPHLDTLRGRALTLEDGGDTTLGADLPAGRASVVSLWATWCAPCLMEARHLAGVRRRIPAAELNILGVNLDRRRDEAAIDRFMVRAGVNYAQARGDLATYQAFGGGEQIRLPRLYLFYADGRPVTVFGRYFGRATLRQVDQAIARAMTGPPPG